MTLPAWTRTSRRGPTSGRRAGSLFAGTFLAGAVSAAPLWTVMPGMLVCAPIAVVGRVVMDTAADPTSHNLWPLEVVLAGIMSVPAICLGAAVAWGVRRLSPSSR